MNILASYEWIKEHLKTDASPEEFAREISLRGPAVEKIISNSNSFDKIVVGRITLVTPHPNADKLRVTTVDVGANHPIQIVCGGSNLEAGQLVAVAMIGAKVKWHGQGDLVEMQKTAIRGVDSYGMICGADEIGLADLFPPSAEKEIVDLSFTKAKPGTNVAEAAGLESPIFDIEATTNRPDCFAIVGLAREAAACGLGRFAYSDWKLPKMDSRLRGNDKLKVVIDEKKLCPRYMAAVVRGVKVEQSPSWLRARLMQAGVRPINNVVDITNYVMLELGHPMHAFDRSAVVGDMIHVRKAKSGEKFLALDGKTYQLANSNLVIANAHAPMAIAGVMGGEESGSTEKTVSVVFEAAAFDAVSVRKTSRSHALISDSSLRFEKGLSAEQCAPALAAALELLQELCPDSELVEILDVYPIKAKQHIFAFRPEYAEQLIGEAIPAQKQKKILEALGFEVAAKGKKWQVKVPYWREHDIEGERDLVEEVARVFGYHNIAPRLPDGELSKRVPAIDMKWEDEVKRFMEASGWTELMTYAFTNAAAYAPVGRPVSNLLEISNPLSSDFTHMRDMLLPGMLQVVRENQERFPSEHVYELGNVYTPGKPGELPNEGLRFLALSYGHDDEAFTHVKGLLEAVSMKFGFAFELKPTEAPQNFALHPGRSAVILVGGEMVGVLGELSPDVLTKAGIAKRAGMLTFKFDTLVHHLTSAKAFKGIPEFPSVKRDVSFVVDEKVTHEELIKAFHVDAQVVGAERFDEYRGKGVGDGKKSLAYHLEFRNDAGTMTSETADALLEKIREVLKTKFQADVRS